MLLWGTHPAGQCVNAEWLAANRAVDRDLRGDARHRKNLLEERGQARTSAQTGNSFRNPHDNSCFSAICVRGGPNRASPIEPAAESALTAVNRDTQRRPAPTAETKFHFPLYTILQIEFEPSSVTSSDPSGATVIPTGRPHTVPLGVTNPVTKSSYSPLACPVWCRGTRITS